MRHGKDSFRHESLQDASSIQDILKAITKGLGKGKLSFKDENGELLMEPEGLLNLKVTAGSDGDQHRLDIRVTWQSDDQVKSRKGLKVE